MTFDGFDDLPPLRERRMILATDLDGTFLGGTNTDRSRLYDWINANRETVGLVFVTGRHPEFVMELCASGEAPWPEIMIGDVGTTIARVVPHHEITPIPELEEEIAALWKDSGERVRTELDGHPGLTLQPTEFRYRVSYDLDAEKFDRSAVAKIRALGLDPLISDNRFFDVLPPGTSKGPSLRRLVDWLGADHMKVLAAGDTMNDLSMLVSGVPAVAVGNSEAPLVAEISGHETVHHAKAHGAAGILEAIDTFGLHDVKGV